MLYQIGSHIFTFAVRQFFREIRCVGAPLCEEGPLLVVANHPNFMLDSLVVNSVYKRDLWFLAKATLFRGALLKAFLERAHLVPVYRRQDNPADMSRNEETFAFATERLTGEGAIVIFPEGVSLGERKLSPIKTGAARIALQAEVASQFRLGLRIQAIGLTYTELQSFRSAVTVTVSEPIRVADLEQRYHANALETVRELTAQLEQALKQVTVEVAEVEHAQLLEKIGKLYEAHTALVDHRERYRTIARNLELLGPKLNETRRELEEWINFFFEVSSLFSLVGSEPLRLEQAPGVRGRVEGLIRAVFVVCGIIIHYIPYTIISQLVPRLSSHPVSIASCKFAAGLVLMPLWYLLLLMIMAACGLGWLTLSFALLLFLASGIMANRFLPEMRVRVLAYLWPGARKPHEILRSMRESLISRLEQLRVE